MDRLIRPDIFGKDVNAFFTTRALGTDIREIIKILSVKVEDIFLPVQKHTNNVLVLEEDGESRIADAVITKSKGILIGVQVADCVPMLLYDYRKSVIGSVHAGWRGTTAQIIKKTIQRMGEYFHSSPNDIKIALGPSIRGDCYVVDNAVKEGICRATGSGRYYEKHTDGKYWIDLASANALQALSVGIPEEHIWISSECTLCNPEKYYSYRRGKDLRGRQGGFIGIL